MKSSILARQDQPKMLELLRAISVSHARVQRLDKLRTVLSVTIAMSGLIAAFINVAALPVTIVGTAWALLYSVGLGSWSGNELRRAAALQEMFDVRLFEIPWNTVATGEQISAWEVSKLSRQYRGDVDILRGYYEIPELPPPIDILACQQQNLGWGAAVRRRYANAVLFFAILLIITGLIIGMTSGMTIVELFVRWYIPSLGAILLGWDTFRSQHHVARERERVFGVVRARVLAVAKEAESVDDLRLLARQVQDVLYLTRKQTQRVPDVFFLRFKNSDRTDFRSTMDDLVKLLRTE